LTIAKGFPGILLMSQTTAHEFFDEWSIYDLVLDHNYMFHDEIYLDVERVLRECYGDRSFAVLDLGCGSARHFAVVLQGRRVGRYVGYDLSEAALSRAKTNLAVLNCRVELHEEDLLEGLNGGSEAFDLIFSGFSLHHLTATETRSFFRSAYRRLNPSGILLMIDTMREADENRQTYLDRYCGWIRSKWKALSRRALDAICEHVRENDFPQTAVELETTAAEAGFGRCREIDRFRWHRTWTFEKHDSAVRVREAEAGDAAAIARVQVDSWRTTYASIMPGDFLARLSYDGRERAWRKILADPERREFVYVAEDENRDVVGFASGGPERSGGSAYRGELYAVYLLENFQRRSIGRQLISAVAERLLQAGLASMLVWVLAKNPARGFYAALGGEVVSEKPTEAGGAKLMEVAYGWRDLRLLVGKNRQIGW
jgi:SAM-dependent methyltransferase